MDEALIGEFPGVDVTSYRPVRQQRHFRAWSAYGGLYHCEPGSKRRFQTASSDPGGSPVLSGAYYIWEIFCVLRG